MSTNSELFEKVYGSEEYRFLWTEPRLSDNIILLGLGGSYAYGTNIPTSDLDIRGITLNSKEDILTNDNFEQFTNEETDTTIYSFNKMITLLSNVNPNTIEMLGLKPDQYIKVSSVGRDLLNNRKMFLSKKCIHSFGGYANQQLYRLQQKSKHSMHQGELEKHILKTIEFMSSDFSTKYSTFDTDSLKLYIDKAVDETMDTEIFMDVDLHHYPLRDYCSMWNELQQVVKSYNKIGKRNEHALEHGKIAKHMMHLVRLYLMVFDILEKEEIVTCRENEHDFLMDIRNGKYLTEDNQVLPEFYEIVDEYEKRLEYDKENTSLPDRPDYKKIRDFQMEVNEQVVKGTICW